MKLRMGHKHTSLIRGWKVETDTKTWTLELGLTSFHQSYSFTKVSKELDELGIKMLGLGSLLGLKRYLNP